MVGVDVPLKGLDAAQTRAKANPNTTISRAQARLSGKGANTSFSFRTVDAAKLYEFLQARLTDERGERDWAILLAGAVEHGMNQPVRCFGSLEVWVEACDALISAELAAQWGRGLVRAVVPVVLEVAAQDKESPDAWWGEAREAWHAWVNHPGLVDSAWVEAWFAEDAMQTLVSDTLYESLRDFSTLVPRVVEKLLPAGLGRLARLGSKASERIFDEVEKHLEAEMRTWLGRGTERALDSASKHCIEHINTPEGAALRRNLVDFAASRSPQVQTQKLDADFVVLLENVAAQSFAAAAKRPAAKQLRDEALAAWLAANQNKTVKTLLTEYGIEADPPVAAWSKLTWPVLQVGLTSGATESWLQGLCSEIAAL